MARYMDFAIKVDHNEDIGSIAEKIIYRLVVKRLKHHKPCIIFIGGDSGEGKSVSALSLQCLIAKCQDIDFKENNMEAVDATNVYTPLEYPQKIDKLLNDKQYKKLNWICIHEAREVVRAKNWHSFLTQSIADVNAMSRAIKPLCIMVISQFIRDITSDIRFTLTYYMTVKRPLGKPAQLSIKVIWKDDKDLERPAMRARNIRGFLIYPDGKYKYFSPRYLEFALPDREILHKFNDSDREAKGQILKKKMAKLIDEMKLDAGIEVNKLNSLVEWYTKSPDLLSQIGKRYKDRWILNKEFVSVLGLSDKELKEFTLKINHKMKERVKNDGEQFGIEQNGNVDNATESEDLSL